MSITVKYFAGLRELIGHEQEQLASEGLRTVADVWARVQQQSTLPTKVLVAVNMEYADLDQAVHDGDEIAFFPPVTGG